MCGIVAYVGPNSAFPIVINGLKRLEYRGYDSAGIATIEPTGGLVINKKKGKVADLLAHIGDVSTFGTIGVGHTRWATHGPPNDLNAHPHKGASNRIAIVHNGIIENFAAIKETLKCRGHNLQSDTDSEVLAHLIEAVMVASSLDVFDAVRAALSQVVGAYALVVIDRENPERLIAARKSSPLVIGIGEDGAYYVASDATPIISHTKNVVYLEDEEVASLDLENGLKIHTISNDIITPEIHALEMELESIEKSGYEHFMLKEIFEQPQSVRDSIRGRINLQHGELKMQGIDDHWHKWNNASRIIILGCGTSWHAGLVAEYMFEEFARIPVEVEYASEFRYRNPIIHPEDVVVVISQSGETADTLAAIKSAKAIGAHVFGVCNVVGSSIARETDSGAYTHAGPEIGVASTKAFTSQVAVLFMMALHVGNRKGIIPKETFSRLLAELNNIPELIDRVLKQSENIYTIAKQFSKAENALYLGRGYQFPIALEGALKLKEISYIHAEGYPAAEMKHGPIALIDDNMPVIFIAPMDDVYEKVVSNVQEVKARGGKLLGIVTDGDKEVSKLADYIIEIPRCSDALAPLISVVPLQLLSYKMAVLRGCNVDQPRNLAKSVTVE
ncbi:MAG: glutamine--fructose-6-phosphate transaminase (isomerizing) [Crocinitomicaceae bacterium]|nr:glutamine--fructose-6-phosphate transaminase (isomerizing) [Crocinitomicaceae bacterium]|tara:strand:+ start:761 stop:2608 length:1848 start_codon:yes stop_codon:yes gene_type:complete